MIGVDQLEVGAADVDHENVLFGWRCVGRCRGGCGFLGWCLSFCCCHLRHVSTFFAFMHGHFFCFYMPPRNPGLLPTGTLASPWGNGSNAWRWYQVPG